MKICIPNQTRISEAAQEFLKLYPSGGVFGLRGDLGVGKTTWVKAVIAEICLRTQRKAPRTTSPSFVVHLSYDTRPRVEHFDLYRLERAEDSDLIEMGFWNAVESCRAERGYLFVEWPEKIKSQNINWTAFLQFSFDPRSENSRWIEFESNR